MASAVVGQRSAARAPHPCDNVSTHLEHTEFWGLLIQSGDQNPQPSSADCCRACHDYEPTIETSDGRPCNAWVYHPTTHACWLKNGEQVHLDKPGRGAHIPWTSGIFHGPYRACDDCVPPATFYGCISKTNCNTSRACGSPAIDGYGHVDVKCFEESPDAKLYNDLVARNVTLQAYSEVGADFDGLGVKWGIGHTKQHWRDCEAACIAHRPPVGGPFGKLPCNVWTWCGSPACWEPDAHKHSFGDCWLKFTEQPEHPEVNMRMPMSRQYMRRHGREMATGVPWVSGALLAPGLKMTNGTWGPRAFW